MSLPEAGRKAVRLSSHKVDRRGNPHTIVGKRSFSEQQLLENYLAVVDEGLRAKPSAAKGKYVISATVAPTMGPGIPLDTNRLKDAEPDGVPA